MSSERERVPVECVWLFFIATIFRKISHHISHHFSHRSTQRGGKFPAGPRDLRDIFFLAGSSNVKCDVKCDVGLFNP